MTQNRKRNQAVKAPPPPSRALLQNKIIPQSNNFCVKTTILTDFPFLILVSWPLGIVKYVNSYHTYHTHTNMYGNQYLETQCFNYLNITLY